MDKERKTVVLKVKSRALKVLFGALCGAHGDGNEYGDDRDNCVSLAGTMIPIKLYFLEYFFVYITHTTRTRHTDMHIDKYMKQMKSVFYPFRVCKNHNKESQQDLTTQES